MILYCFIQYSDNETVEYNIAVHPEMIRESNRMAGEWPYSYRKIVAYFRPIKLKKWGK
jgi:hypothetical protein